MEMSSEEKREALRALAVKRKLDKRDQGYKGTYRDLSEPGLHGDYYEQGWVSPVTNTAHNVDADWMLVLQDWDSADNIPEARPTGESYVGYDPEFPTNRNLTTLFGVLGVERHDLFITNLFPFLKFGGVSATIPPGDLRLAAAEYCRPQINIVRPKAVICGGRATFNALRQGQGLPPVSMRVALDSPFEMPLEAGGVVSVWGQAHPGAFGVRYRGTLEVVKQDWARMRRAVMGGTC